VTQFASLRATRTAYVLRGEGAPILLIHGAEATRESFSALALPLSQQQATPMCVVSYDQRGCGESTGAGSAHGIPDLADDADELMASLGFRRYAVLGTSLGGRIAQALAMAHPDRVETLVLVNTWPLDATLAELNPQGVAQLRRLRAGLPATAAELAAMFYTRSHVASHPALAQRFARPPASPGREALAFETHALAEGRIKARTLCISGSEDPVVPPAVMRDLAARIPRAVFESIPHAGHSIAVQAPEVLASILLKFASRQCAGNPPV